MDVTVLKLPVSFVGKHRQDNFTGTWPLQLNTGLHSQKGPTLDLNATFYHLESLVGLPFFPPIIFKGFLFVGILNSYFKLDNHTFELQIRSLRLAFCKWAREIVLGCDGQAEAQNYGYHRRQELLAW